MVKGEPPGLSPKFLLGFVLIASLFFGVVAAIAAYLEGSPLSALFAFLCFGVFCYAAYELATYSDEPKNPPTKPP